MKFLVLFSILVSVCVVLTEGTLHKRESGHFGCYDLNNVTIPPNYNDFSVFCPPSEWPITNNRGLSPMGVFYFALASTNVADNTTYNTGENIICTTVANTGNITVTAGIGAEGLGIKSGLEVTFSFALPSASNSICMFTESLNATAPADPITLAQARDLLYTMLTTPRIACKTCARVPINYLNGVTDGTNKGGILKLDVVTANNCLGKCVGPNSFTKKTTTSAATSRQLGLGNVYVGLMSLILSTSVWLLL